MAASAAGGTDQQRALILDEIVEVRSHLIDPSLVAVSAALDEPRALAAACYALPAYVREVNREGAPRLWPFTADTRKAGAGTSCCSRPDI